MKDYRLSEIKAHCKARVAKHQNPCKGCEMEVVCKDTFPVGWDIEPRDMLDLPCKLTATRADGSTVYEIVHRGFVSKLICVSDFDTEPEADAFLTNLKGRDKQ